MNIDEEMNNEAEEVVPEEVDVDDCVKKAVTDVEYFFEKAKQIVDEHGLSDIADSEFYTRMLTIMQSQHQVYKSIEMTRKAQLGL